MVSVMVDIETLGTEPGSVVLAIGAQKFDLDGTVGPGFYRPIDVLDSLLAGFMVSPETCAWWAEQSKDAIGALKPAGCLSDALAGFAGYIHGAETIWAKGPDFDLVILQACYRKLGMETPWRYNKARDVRTILSLAPEGMEWPERKGIPHHALADCVHQINSVRAVYLHIKRSL